VGFFSPKTRALYLYNVKENDLLAFHLMGYENVGRNLGQAITELDNMVTTNSAGRWATFDYVEKLRHAYEKEQTRLEDKARQMTIETLRHEGAHQLLHAFGVDSTETYRGAWFSEGLAEYLAPENVDTLNVGRLMHLRVEQEQGFHLMPLQHLLSFPSGSGIHKDIDPNYTLLGYAESWAFVYFLMENYKESFFTYIKDLKLQDTNFNAEKDIALLETHIGKPLSEIESTFENYISGLIKEKIDENEYLLYAIFQKT